MPTLDEQSVTYAPVEATERLRRVIVRILPWIEIACCAALVGLLLWKGILPGWRVLNTDFPNYYLVARLLREGYPLDRVYDWVWLQRVKDHWGLDQPLVGFAGLTPFSALPIVPFSFFSPLAAKRLWILVNVLLSVTSIELLNKVTSLGRRRIWLLFLLAVFPLRTSFLFGQMHLLVLFLLVLAYFFHHKGKRTACAAWLSVAGLLKIYPLLFGIYFLWKRQWRTAFAMLSATLLLLGAAYLWVGGDVIHIYATQVLPRSLQGEVLDPYNAHAASVAALFHRLFIFEPTLNPAPLRNSPLLYAVLYPLWQLSVLVPLLALLHKQRTHAGVEQLEWAAYLFALLVLSPVPASYHFVVMVFSIVLLVDFLLTRRCYGNALLAIVLYCAISMVEFMAQGKGASAGTFLAFRRLWAELLLWGVFLFCLWQNRAERKSRPADGLHVASLYVLVVVGWTGGAVGYHRHFAHMEQDVARRMPVAVPAYLSTGVRHTFNGYVFTAMLADGYRVVDQAGREVWKNHSGRPPMDELSAAVAQNAPGLLVELSDGSGSRIAIMPSGVPSSQAPQDALPLIADAESPAISASGGSVGFIREVKGRGTLWWGHLDPALGRMRSKPRQIADNGYDIRDFGFARSGWIIFAAKVDGHLSIFSLVPGSEPRVLLSEDEDVDSPAVSRDERFIAFRKLVHSRWQLGYLDLATGHERMLTFGDCNAYGPEWAGPRTIEYATDCGRGLGLSALASIGIGSRLP